MEKIKVGGVHTSEKTDTHEAMWPYIVSWVEERFAREQEGRIITMPADSGVQENQILEYIMELEAKYHIKSPVKLLTYDNRFEAHETGIKYTEHWRHTKCGDIFKEMYQTLEPACTLAWFDMCGPLSESTRVGVLRTMPLMLPESKVFFTLQVHASRALNSNSILKRLYREYGGTAKQNIEITAVALQGLARPLKAEPLLIAPYRRRVSTFCVFGFELQQPKEEEEMLELQTEQEQVSAFELEREEVVLKNQALPHTQSVEEQIEEKRKKLMAELQALDSVKALTEELQTLRKEREELESMLRETSQKIDTIQNRLKTILGQSMDVDRPIDRPKRTKAAYMSMHRRHEMIINLIAKNPGITAREISVQIDLNVCNTYNYLNRLKDIGRIYCVLQTPEEQTTNKPNNKYYVK